MQMNSRGKDIQMGLATRVWNSLSPSPSRVSEDVGRSLSTRNVFSSVVSLLEEEGSFSFKLISNGCILNFSSCLKSSEAALSFTFFARVLIAFTTSSNLMPNAFSASSRRIAFLGSNPFMRFSKSTPLGKGFVVESVTFSLNSVVLMSLSSSL